MRIPPVEAADADKQVQKVYDTLEKHYGTALNPLRTMAYKPQLMRAAMTLYGAIHAPNPNLSEELKELVSIRVSQINGCRHYCVPYHTLQAKKHGASDAKIAAVAKARNNPVFSELEQLAIEYSERVTVPSMLVTDEFFDRLKSVLSNDDIVELTAVISFMNFWSKTIDALEVPLDDVFAEAAHS